MVSVIIPVYNVRGYLRRCVSSVQRQTHQELDVILVDDGSTDGSGVLCDSLAAEDARIRVIHKANGGLSSARNAGIEMAQGEFIMFVDGDDWLHPHIVELFLADIMKHHVCMAMCEMLRTSDEHDGHRANVDSVVLEGSDVFCQFLKGRWITACAKLYRRQLWDDVRFPEGLNNEDYATLPFIFDQCDRVAYRQETLYFYFIHEGSICRSSLNAHTFDEFQTGQMVLSYCQEHHPQWEHLALFNLTASIIKLTGKCIVSGMYLDRYEEMRDYYLVHKSEILNNLALGMQYKPFLWCLGCSRVIHRWFVEVYNLWKR